MRKIYGIYTILAAAILLLASCGDGRRPDKAMSQYIETTQTAGRVVELITAVSLASKEEFRQGDTVRISYTKKEESLVLDSAVLYVQGKRIGKMDGTREYILGSDHSTGRVPFRVVAYQGADSMARGGEFTVWASVAPEQYTYRVIKSYPHDKTAYTQGLFWHEGFLYESTGLTRQSTLRKVQLETGRVLQSRSLDNEYFGEGAVLLDGKIYQLTWQHNKGFVYDAETFKPLSEFGYAGEGWGLTTDSTYLYMSNGTEKITVLDPQTLRPVRSIDVYSDRGRMTMLNELEWIDGEIWANVYLSDVILRIDPQTGIVKGIIDMRRILSSADKDLSTDVLNGIAYDPATGRIFVTGKNWKKLFEIEVIKLEAAR